MKKILYIDMDGVLVDFQSGIDAYKQKWEPQSAIWEKYEGHWDEVSEIFGLMHPMPGAVDAFHCLAQMFDTYILSTAPWNNATAWKDKCNWVKQFLGDAAHKRLILTHNKHLMRGHYLIDDRTANGADRFEGTLIQFGTAGLENWEKVMARMETEF
jgi:5'-nucleotidase